MSDLGPLIESLEADVARLKAELARVKAREVEADTRLVDLAEAGGELIQAVFIRAFCECAEWRKGKADGHLSFPEVRCLAEREARRRLAKDAS